MKPQHRAPGAFVASGWRYSPPTRIAAFGLSAIRAVFGRALLVTVFTAAALAVVQDARALDPNADPGDYVTSYWDFEAGLPHDTVRHLMQTQDGYLWVGTQRGVARFDGLRFTTFDATNTPEMTNDRITTMAQTPDGDVWIGTAEGLLRYRKGAFSYFGTGRGLNIGTINLTAIAPDGTLWVGGREGVARWANGRFENETGWGRKDLLGVHSLLIEKDGTLWLTVDAEIIRKKGSQVDVFGRPQGLPGAQILQVLRDWNGRMLAATQNGIFVLNGSRFEPLPQNAGLASQRVSRLLFDAAGNLWVGSTGGLDRIFEGKVAHYRKKDGRQLGVIDAICEDREGCLWLGGSEGLYRFTNRRASPLTQDDGLGGSLGISVRQTRDGVIWTSTWAGGVDRIENESMTHLRVGAPLSHETVTTIHEAPDGVLWFGNRGSSVDRFEGGKVTTYVFASGVSSNRPVRALHTDDDGTLLIGIASRGLLELRDGVIRPVPGSEMLATQSILKFFRPRNGGLMLLTSAGLFARQPDKSLKPVVLPGLPSQLVARDILEEVDGTCWVATEGQGLIRWRGESARAFKITEGMIDNAIASVLDDQLGSIWVSSSRGLARIRKSDFDAVEQGRQPRLNPVTITRSDGAPSGSTSGQGNPDATRLADGRLMFATTKGFAIIDPHAVPVNTQPPSVVVESLRADGQPAGTRRDTIVAAATQRIEIRYTALSLVAPERLRFRYKLEGSDAGWIEAGHERSATYTHLAPGQYTFRVTACNNDGIWNEKGATFTFVKEAWFYQTRWFQILAGAAISGIIVGGLGLRVRQMHRRETELARINAELDARVNERTAELSRSYQELAHRESLFRLIFEHAPVGVSWHRTDQGDRYHFNETFRRILGLESETLSGNAQIAALTHPDDAPRLLEMERKIHSGAVDSYTLEQRFVRRDGRLVWGLLAAAVVRDADGKVIQVIGLLEDITARKQAEEELVKTHKRLLDASRMAGMAEVASGVLHDVGNVLNSANVSAGVLLDRLRRTNTEGLAKISTLLQEHAANLADFLANDPRGKRIPDYLGTLAGHLRAERDAMVDETRALRDRVEHISEIVARQQGFARLTGLYERLAPVELMEDALRMNDLSLARHGVAVTREFASVPNVLAERHKVLQILINLVKNAKQAVDGNQPGERMLTLRVRQGDDVTVLFDVIDNGVGIAPENLTRIFEHGFTTRPDGHGFGLHASANAAREMHGALSVHSDGPGSGATFTLSLPVATLRPSAAA